MKETTERTLSALDALADAECLYLQLDGRLYEDPKRAAELVPSAEGTVESFSNLDGVELRATIKKSRGNTRRQAFGEILDHLLLLLVRQHCIQGRP